MVRSGGKRSNSKHIHSKPFRKKGNSNVSTYMQNFKIGEYVDIVINSIRARLEKFLKYQKIQSEF